jgi:hypothetical protein
MQHLPAEQRAQRKLPAMPVRWQSIVRGLLFHAVRITRGMTG